MKTIFTKVLLISFMTSMFIGCGGSGSSTTTPTATPPPTDCNPLPF